MPVLIRVHPTSLSNVVQSPQTVVTLDKRVQVGGFMMLVKGNATVGMEGQNNGTQTEQG